MTQILELAASELVQKVQRGEVPPTARVHVTLDNNERLSDDVIALRLASWRKFVADASVSGANIDDSREAIYAETADRA